MTRILFAWIATALICMGCNTIEGAGKDIQKAGEKIEDAAASKKK